MRRKPAFAEFDSTLQNQDPSMFWPYKIIEIKILILEYFQKAIFHSTSIIANYNYSSVDLNSSSYYLRIQHRECFLGISFLVVLKLKCCQV